MMAQLLLEDRECTVKSKDDGTTVVRGKGMYSKKLRMMAQL
jgi:hypothetical protein